MEEVSTTKRRWPRVVGISVGAILLLGLGGVFGTRAFYSRTFDNLVDTTSGAEGAQVWRDFFIAQDCFIDSAVDSTDPVLVFDEGLALLDKTDLLARHVSLSLSSFNNVTVLPFHGALAAARDAIAAHYEVWEGHLGEASGILAALDPEPSALAGQFQDWVGVVVGDAEAIESTFNDAESAFEMAARDDPSRLAIDTLFTPSEAECSRGAV